MTKKEEDITIGTERFRENNKKDDLKEEIVEEVPPAVDIVDRKIYLQSFLMVEIHLNPCLRDSTTISSVDRVSEEEERNQERTESEVVEDSEDLVPCSAMVSTTCFLDMEVLLLRRRRSRRRRSLPEVEEVRRGA